MRTLCSRCHEELQARSGVQIPVQPAHRAEPLWDTQKRYCSVCESGESGPVQITEPDFEAVLLACAGFRQLKPGEPIKAAGPSRSQVGSTPQTEPTRQAYGGGWQPRKGPTFKVPLRRSGQAVYREDVDGRLVRATPGEQGTGRFWLAHQLLPATDGPFKPLPRPPHPPAWTPSDLNPAPEREQRSSEPPRQAYRGDQGRRSGQAYRGFACLHCGEPLLGPGSPVIHECRRPSDG